MGVIDGETWSCSDTCVTGGVGGTGEGGVKVEEIVDIKDEIPEDNVFPPIKTEHEVRLWGDCEVVTAVMCEVVTAVVCEVVTAVVCEVTACVRWLQLLCVRW
jgi:hypothetical protein